MSEATSPKSSPPRRRSAFRSGFATGAAFLVLGGSGAAAAALLAQKFGRNAETDGLLAAYAIYTVLTIAAQSFRLVVLPRLAHAAADGALAGETRAYVVSLLLIAAPITAASAVFADPLGRLITGSLPHAAASTAASALPWVVASAFLQLLAGVCASALAASDSYTVAAVGIAAGGVGGLAFFVLFESHGVIALAWGLALNGAIAFGVSLAALAVRGLLLGGPRVALAPGSRLWSLVQGALLPVAFQCFYLVALRLAAGLGVGSVTSLSYAYVLAGTLVSVTAFALSLISSVPLTRRGVDPAGAVQHVVHSAWVSLGLVGAAAGIFAVVGGPVVHAILGSAYAGTVGANLGRLVVELTPWMIVAATFYSLFPLVFVLDARRVLVPLSLVSVAVDVGITYAFREAWGLTGIAIALAVATALVVGVLLWEISRQALLAATVALVRLSVVVGAAAVAAFWGASAVLGPVGAALAGSLVYAMLLVAVARFGLRDAWAYVRGLH